MTAAQAGDYATVGRLGKESPGKPSGEVLVQLAPDLLLDHALER